MESTRTRLAVEGALIVVSIVLGFVVNEWRQSLADRDLAAAALERFEAEIQGNLGVMEPQIAAHRSWIDALARPGATEGTRTAFEAIFRNRPGDPANVRPLSRAAWDAAVSTGTLRLLDYETAAKLSEIYVAQESVYGNVTRLMLSVLYTPATFDPTQQAVAVDVLRWALTEVEGNERFLADLYRKHLPAIRAVTGE